VSEPTRLETIAETVRKSMEATHAAREVALKQSRDLIALCARAIRALHREEWESADSLLATAASTAATLVAGVHAFPELYHAGYTQDSLKEYAEARLTAAFIRHTPLPAPADLHVEPATWINGLAEAASELRRRILDILRHSHSDEAEQLLDMMDEVYSLLITFDFSDSITGGLRRRTDALRAVLERTRGDVTNSLRQTRLEEALQKMERQYIGRS
jgi:translin